MRVYVHGKKDAEEQKRKEMKSSTETSNCIEMRSELGFVSNINPLTIRILTGQTSSSEGILHTYGSG